MIVDNLSLNIIIALCIINGFLVFSVRELFIANKKKDHIIRLLEKMLKDHNIL